MAASKPAKGANYNLARLDMDRVLEDGLGGYLKPYAEEVRDIHFALALS
jgi:hypothetical protein